MTVAEQATLAWVNNFVVHHGLCPFAALPLRQGRVLTVACEAADSEAAFYWALTQVQSLLEVPANQVETTLLVFPELLSDFSEFLAFVEAVEDALAQSGADALVQLAHFHPDYTFADVAIDDAGNATNRSPYPTLQLLRSASVAAAVEDYRGIDRIPERNIALLRAIAARKDD